jgi:hypothetical protein
VESFFNEKSPNFIPYQESIPVLNTDEIKLYEWPNGPSPKVRVSWQTEFD